MDKSWEVIQKKTFTNWINNKLKIRSIPPLNNIDTDLASGETLIQLLEIIGDESLGRYNKAPKMRLQKIENMNTALAFIKRRGVALTNIGAEDVVDSNVKLILGLIWSIILRFTIADITMEGLTAKEGLLLWVQKRTTPYVQDFFVKDFTYSWQNGLAFCGLIHRHRPDLLDYWALDKSKKHENTHLAFEIAERELGIPKLFAVEDILDVTKPDERSVMTYVAQYFHAFAEMDKLGNATRRVGQFGQVMSQIWQMQNDYERRVRKLMADVSDIQSTWNSSSFSGYPDARCQLQEFDTYKNTVKRGWVVEKRDLDTLIGNIQTKLTTYHLAAYVPPQGCTPADLERAWSGHINFEAERKKKISAYIREIKVAVKKAYAEAANSYQSEVNSISLFLAKALDSGELEAQLANIQGLQSQVEPYKSKLTQIQQLFQACVQANIEDNEYSIYSVEDLSFELGILVASLSKTHGFLENQIVARTMTNITPAQLDSYSETFKHFDKDNTNSLSKDEFKAALQAEGVGFNDVEVDKVFGNDSRKVGWQGFLDFMKKREEDNATPEQLEISFKALALDRDGISEGNMRAGGLPGHVVEFFKGALPTTSNGEYDYKSYLNKTFGK